MEQINMKDNQENNNYIFIGELRDKKAFEESLNASISGHLVLTSACFNRAKDIKMSKEVL